MTTYAYRNGVLAADTAVSSCDVIHGSVVKIAQRGDYFAAASGNARMSLRFIEWFRTGMKGEPPPMADGVGDDVLRAYAHIFTPTDLVIRFEPGGYHHQQAPYVADGSGMHLALGALAAGATAEEAVGASIKHDIYSRGPVTVLKRDSILLPVTRDDKIEAYESLLFNLAWHSRDTIHAKPERLEKMLGAVQDWSDYQLGGKEGDTVDQLHILSRKAFYRLGSF